MDVDDSKFVTDKNIQDAFASLGAPPHVCRAKANQIISSFDKVSSITAGCVFVVFIGLVLLIFLFTGWRQETVLGRVPIVHT